MTDLQAFRRGLAELEPRRATESIPIRLRKLALWHLAAQRQALFSPTSEKQKRDSKPTKKAPQTGHGPTPQPELPISQRLATRTRV